jgi:Spy/CpxP family protein refolding chaperone
MRAVLVLLAFASIAHADPTPPDDPIGERLFPPDLIMAHQQDLGLDDATRKSIVTQVQEFQTAAVKLQWDMKAAGDALAKALDGPSIDEPKTLALADKVMSLERDLKRAHLTLLVRLKNALTPAQQAKLRTFRKKP